MKNKPRRFLNGAAFNEADTTVGKPELNPRGSNIAK